MSTVENNKRVGGPAPRPPSKLPPQGDLCLHLSIEAERLGCGRVGSVYPVKLYPSSQYCLPSLVIKVAARRRSADLAREAWFYEEMEHIQGVAIPQCYGFFTAEIDANSEVMDWAETDADYDPEKGDTPLEEEWDDDDQNDTKEVSDVSLPASNGMERTLVSLLVLERFGGMMPTNVSLKSIEPDLQEIYSDIGRFSIEHRDVRWRNILEAPSTHDGLVCPFHGHKHQWRVIDFDYSRKSGFKHAFIEDVHNSYIESLLDGLPRGWFPEPRE